MSVMKLSGAPDTARRSGIWLIPASIIFLLFVSCDRNASSDQQVLGDMAEPAQTARDRNTDHRPSENPLKAAGDASAPPADALSSRTQVKEARVQRAAAIYEHGIYQILHEPPAPALDTGSVASTTV